MTLSSGGGRAVFAADISRMRVVATVDNGTLTADMCYYICPRLSTLGDCSSSIYKHSILVSSTIFRKKSAKILYFLLENFYTDIISTNLIKPSLKIYRALTQITLAIVKHEENKLLFYVAIMQIRINLKQHKNDNMHAVYEVQLGTNNHENCTHV